MSKSTKDALPNVSGSATNSVLNRRARLFTPFSLAALAATLVIAIGFPWYESSCWIDATVVEVRDATHVLLDTSKGRIAITGHWEDVGILRGGQKVRFNTFRNSFETR